MTCGIYQYTDIETGDVVYIGKDSYIHRNKRHKQHLQKSMYNEQPFNRVLQNNPERYQYEILYAGDYDEDLLNVLEINTIAEFKQMHNGKRPKFNFTDGGDGITGYIHTKEAKQKMSEANKGKTFSEEHRKRISESMEGKSLSEETCKKISEAKKGHGVSEETRRKISEGNKGKTLSEEHKKKISESQNTTGYFRVVKHKRKDYKQGFTYAYNCYDENNKRRTISRKSIPELKEAVLEKGLPWKKFDKVEVDDEY